MTFSRPADMKNQITIEKRLDFRGGQKHMAWNALAMGRSQSSPGTQIDGQIEGFRVARFDTVIT
jgi:hypothetical protein